MSEFKRRVTAPQTINQVWNGVATTGLIARSGGFEQVAYVDHNLKLLGSGDCGGPMILQRQTTSYSYGYDFNHAHSGVGSQVCVQPSAWSTIPSQPLSSTLYGLGGTAISRTIPNDPSFAAGDALAQTIGRDAIPKMMGSALWRNRTLEFRNLGHEYLNYQFGWLPFISDIKSCLSAVRNSNEELQKLRKGSDKKTRVGYHFPESATFSNSGGPSFVFSWDGSKSGWGAGNTVYSGVTGSAVWFSGCFRYHLPVTPEQMDKSQRFADYADHILGIDKITPEMLWDAAPWSWAVDWAINVGDVAHNIGAIGHDGLYLQYGYIMCHSWKTDSYTSLGGATSTGSTARSVREWKVRFPASPYGFGLTYDGLTATQKSILAAVGLNFWKEEKL